MLSPDIIAPTARRLAGIVNTTPVMTSRTLNGRVGAQLFLKCENFQRVGAFKFRGAYNTISQLSDAQKEAGVITHSSGNHAQGVALAAKLLGVQATIVMPDNAPAIKKAATAGYGARIITCPAVDREKTTAALVKQHGYTLVHPYNNAHIIAGQGTAAYELFTEVGELDALFVPVGGGGLISGSALAAAAVSPNCRVIGVEPTAGNDANRSWRQNQIVTLDTVPDTVADGLRTRFIGERNLAVMRQYVHDMTTVSDDAILDTLNFLWTRLKLVVEPSAAAALAPLLTGDYPPPGPRIGVILSGGNVDVSAVARLLSDQADAGRPQPAPAASAEPAPSPSLTTNTPAAKPAVLVCGDLDATAVDILRPVATVDIRPQTTSAELGRHISSYQALLVGRETRLSSNLLEEAYHLRAIAVASSRLDNVDVSTARAMGIDVLHAPGSTAVAIAEHLISRLLLLTERFSDGRLAGKTLGLIGYGSVAEQITRRAKAFDMEILVNQPRLTPELALADVEAVDLIDLLQRADFVSLHVPFKQETSALIGPAELAHMPPHACLINTGHTDLVDDAALLAALEANAIAGAALSEIPSQAQPTEAALTLRRHPSVIVAPHVTAIIDDRQRDAAIHVARQLANLLKTDEASDTLSLELVPTHLVTPHEHIDPKRVARLRTRLEADGRLVNPPITTPWHGRYIILDGATRYTAMKEMGLPHVIVQAVPPDQAGFELHTWYHAISNDASAAPNTLYNHLSQLQTVTLHPLPAEQLQNAFQNDDALCYFLDRDGEARLATAVATTDHLTAMNDLVAAYTAWGSVERTLLTDLPRLLAQFPQMVAVAVFPQFTPSDVFDAARAGDFLPAGLTRFVIPGRILRLNADLTRLQGDIPLAKKRAWFNAFLEQKLARSRLRYYQEPVILLDE